MSSCPIMLSFGYQQLPVPASSGSPKAPRPPMAKAIASHLHWIVKGTKPSGTSKDMRVRMSQVCLFKQDRTRGMRTKKEPGEMA